MKKLFTLLFVGFSVANYAQDITNTRFGKGLINVIAKDSSWSSKVAFRYQTRYEGLYDYSDSAYTDRAFVRRARIKGSGYAFSPRLKYKFEYDVHNGFVLDAVVKWNFAGNWTVWFGQTKLPGNIERVFSSQKLQLVDRSLLNSKFTLDRDAGGQLRHHFTLGNRFLVRSIFAFSQGEGLNQKPQSSGHGYTGRIELLPFGKFTKKGDYFASDLKREESPKLMLSATYDYNQKAMRERGQMGDYISDNFIGELRDLESIFIDAHFKLKGFSFFGEYVNKVTRNGSAVLEGVYDNILGEYTAVTQSYYTGKAINLQMGYLMKSNWEVAGRFTQVTPEAITLNNNINQYTLGFSRYVVGHNLKVQGDISLTQEDTKENKLMFRLQTEFNF
ncbi:MAG: FmdC precursor [Crocinitomicaceae bacterium]|nr:FmdC precursor [Crocinitomicaceae bacterium]|tara:strand:+ start:3415 stop:4578 length:1164 start_codon:yes stop_codon:yes gene_type:complete